MCIILDLNYFKLIAYKKMCVYVKLYFFKLKKKLCYIIASPRDIIYLVMQKLL